ncbi:hypothetical protein COB57_02365 [Candidatus Peregrinibacteria bacterium]|nr:MAG: hypothetical protein COB57_02365 [Candidatus Peregrinibacteria bacterium]
MLHAASSPIIESKPDFLMKVFGYTGMALLTSAFGVYVAPQILSPEFLMGGGRYIFFGIELLLIFTASWWSQLPRPANILLYLLFAFISGMTIYPLIMVAGMTLGMGVITKAAIATAALSVAAGVYAKITRHDLVGMTGIFTMLLIGLIIVGILQMFWFSSVVELYVSGFSVIFFTFFIARDIQAVSLYPENRAIEASMSLYLSIFNLFISILRLLMALNRD